VFMASRFNRERPLFTERRSCSRSTDTW
jgi:hypothetical protein